MDADGSTSCTVVDDTTAYQKQEAPNSVIKAALLGQSRTKQFYPELLVAEIQLQG
jgi:hypothetical protein